MHKIKVVAFEEVVPHEKKEWKNLEYFGRKWNKRVLAEMSKMTTCDQDFFDHFEPKHFLLIGAFTQKNKIE